MEKQIMDYLHLYLGCKHRYRFVDSPNWSVWIDLLPHRLSRLDDLSISGIQLALRPLSSMTLVELDEICAQIGYYDYGKLDEIDTLFYDLAANRELEKIATLIKYLLSKHFDLFGLIESGLAIDATTLTQPQT